MTYTGNWYLNTNSIDTDPSSKQKLLAALEVSEPTLRRDLEYMCSRLGAPIAWKRQTGGYCSWTSCGTAAM